MAKLFPDDFLWGASTSGHQVEGGNYDQWTTWELKHAGELAASAEKRLSKIINWEEFGQQAEATDNYISGTGVDHLNRYEEDFDLLAKLGLNAYRFSIEWSRLEPEEGKWDIEALNFYRRYITELKSRGIEPILNLWHWTQPVWFERQGGFKKYNNIGYFLRFVSKVAEEFANDITYVITLNEPNIYVSYTEWFGKISVPPEESRLKRLLIFYRLIQAHKMAYVLLKKANPNFKVSAAIQMASNKPVNKKLSSRIAAKLVNKFGNEFFYDRSRRQIDFIGFNYYFTNCFNGFKLQPPKTPKSDLGFYMEPSAVGEVANLMWRKYKKPVMVTENGLADSEDKWRQWWLKETMQSLARCTQAGTELIGYMHWSLLDNFEWGFGWWPKFGLVEVDRNNMRRHLRPSAVWWAKQLRMLPRE